MILRHLALLWLLMGTALATAGEIRIADFGAKGDGLADDGPAIHRAVEALRSHVPPVTLRFEKGRTYRVKTSPSTWVLTLDGLRDLTLDGNGSTFVLAPQLRLIHLTGCSRVTVRGFSLDFDPLPFADGTIIAKNPADRSVDVKVSEGFALPPLGGPTRQREQAYFAMLWHQGPHSLIGEHYFVEDMRVAYSGSLKDWVVRVVAAPGFQGFAGIHEGQTRISLPVRGVAHKAEGHGASPAILIEENDSVCCEDMNVWSAPLFAVNVARNRGHCVFRRFDIRPKPGTGRLTSSWRDGFHVKGNYARLLWEDCHLEGMNDDAFNIATHSSRVVAAISPKGIRIRQNFPLGFVPFGIGDTLTAFDVSGRRLLGKAKVASAETEGEVDRVHPDRPAPQLLLTLDPPLIGIEKGDVVWNESSANQDTTLRRCKIFNSCRFQSPVNIDNCDITAFCWFYGDNIEGPLPRNVVIQNSRLRVGRGNRGMVASFTSLVHGPEGNRVLPRKPVIANVLLQGNTLDGVLDIGFAEDVRLSANRFLSPRGQVILHDSRAILLEGNTLGDSPLDRLEKVSISDEQTRAAIVIRGR
jgi:hypothetical protein